MPSRKIPLVNNQFYHVFNKSINKEPIFVNKRNAERFTFSLNFYRYKNPPIRLSHFFDLEEAKRTELINLLKSQNQLIVEIISFCLMPNHFHLLLKQKIENGITIFLANIQNSFTRYYNLKNNRTGPLFCGRFKAVLIETEEELVHVLRYIHLNPYSSFLVKDFNQLLDYPWTSLSEYLSEKENICSKKYILNYFKYNTSKITKFHQDHADYQRKLEVIKNLIFE